jgi:hypothetical protein
MKGTFIYKKFLVTLTEFQLMKEKTSNIHAVVEALFWSWWLNKERKEEKETQKMERKTCLKLRLSWITLKGPFIQT